MIALAATACLALPASAGATKVGLSGIAAEPSECFPPQGNSYASTYCQLFHGAELEVVAVASRDDGGVRLMEQPFTLFALGRGGPTPIRSFTRFDENDADDRQVIVPPRSSDYELRFNGNEDMPPGSSATMVVEVGALITIPPHAASGRGDPRLPVSVTVPSPALRGRLQLRRCHRAKAFSAASCARPRSYTVLASRAVRSSRQVAFTVPTRPRSMGRYEIAFRPRSKGFATTRRAFSVVRGFDGVTRYRPTVRATPFGNR